MGSCARWLFRRRSGCAENIATGWCNLVSQPGCGLSRAYHFQGRAPLGAAWPVCSFCAETEDTFPTFLYSTDAHGVWKDARPAPMRCLQLQLLRVATYPDPEGRRQSARCSNFKPPAPALAVQSRELSCKWHSLLADVESRHSCLQCGRSVKCVDLRCIREMGLGFLEPKTLLEGSSLMIFLRPCRACPVSAWQYHFTHRVIGISIRVGAMIIILFMLLKS